MANMFDQNALEDSLASAAENAVAPSIEPVELGPPPIIEPVVVMAPPPPPVTDEPREGDAVPVEQTEDVGKLYIECRTLLFYGACRKFRIPECYAESLIQEVFLSYLQSGTKIDNSRGWLVAAMCNASRHYWRTQGRTEQLPEDFARQSDPASLGLAEQFALEMTLQQCLRYLQPRCRETLELHYYEGRSASEVAAEMKTTVRYAEKLIHNCLRRCRHLYHNHPALADT